MQVTQQTGIAAYSLSSLATGNLYLRARSAYSRLRPYRGQFAKMFQLAAEQRANLSVELQAYCWQRELFTKALESSNARVVFGLHFMTHPGVRGAIRSHGAYTFFMQHGLFSGAWPTHDFHGADQVLLWSSRAAEELNRFRTPLPTAVITGNPKLEALIPATDYSAGSARNTASQRQRVLVLGTNGDTDRDVRALRLAASALPDTDFRQVTFRPHPAEPKERYYSMVSEGLIRADQLDSTPDVYTSLQSVDVVLGTQSTLLIEAAAIAIPVVQLLPELFEQDWSRYGMPSASTPEKLTAILDQLRSEPAAAQRALQSLHKLVDGLIGNVNGAAERAADAIERQLAV
jgi:hypothetical protein